MVEMVRERAMLGLRDFFTSRAQDEVGEGNVTDKKEKTEAKKSWSLVEDSGLSEEELRGILFSAFHNIILQACEKIDLTRKVAAECLCNILHGGDESLLRLMPEVELLKSVFFSKAQQRILDKYGTLSETHSVRWMSATEAFPRLGRLLSSEAWAMAALEGLTVSAGGLTESTMRAASEEVLRQAGDEAEKGREALEVFLHRLAWLFQSRAESPRLVGPLLVLLEKLLTSGSLEPLMEASDDCQPLSALLILSIKGTARKRAPPKVVSGVNVACGFLQFHPDSAIVGVAKNHLCRILAHVYPRVRRATALAFYEALLTYADLDNHSELVLQLLLNTNWDRELGELRETLDEIAARLNLPSPLPPIPPPPILLSPLSTTS